MRFNRLDLNLLVTFDPSEDREPLSDYNALRKELKKFDPELAQRPEIVALSKADIPEVREAHAGLAKKFAKKKIELHLVSAATGEGMRDLTIALYKMVSGKAKLEDWEMPPAPREEAPKPKAAKPKPAKPKPAKKKAKVAPKKKKTTAKKKIATKKRR